MRPIALIFGILLTLGGLVEIAFGYAVSSGTACGFALSCTGPHGGISFGGFRILFGVLLLVLGLALIALSLRPRRWGGGGPYGGRRGMYGPGYGGFGPRRMGPMGAPLVCPTCGGRNGPRFQHCRFCGASLSGAAVPPGAPPPPP